MKLGLRINDAHEKYPIEFEPNLLTGTGVKPNLVYILKAQQLKYALSDIYETSYTHLYYPWKDVC